MRPDIRSAASSGSIPLYFAAAVTQCAALAVLANQMPSTSFVASMMMLTLAGFTGAWILRRLGMSSGFLRVASFGLAILAMLLITGQGLLDGAGGSNRMVNERQLITTMALVSSIGSFFLVTDESVAFTGVWGLAIIGLAATTDVNFSLIASFATFLLAVVFVLVHQHALSQAPEGRRAELSRGGLLLRQASTAAGLWALTIALGVLVSIPLRMVGRNLSLSQVVDQLRVNAQNQQRRVPIAGRLTEAAGQFSIGMGPIRDDRTVVMRVWAPEPLLWRGRTYASYTGRGWLSDDNTRGGRELAPTSRNGDARVFTLEPTLSRPEGAVKSISYRVQAASPVLSLIYQPGDLRRIEVSTDALYRNQDGSVGAFSYLSNFAAVADVLDIAPEVLDRTSTEYPEGIRATFLRMDSNPRLAALASEAVRGKSGPWSKAEAIRRFVAERCTYTLEARRVPENRDAVEFFLSDSREGYCDLYSSAVAVLARHAGLPSRIATGFSSGEEDESDPTATVLRESHRHAWPEIYFNGYGWVAFDPTSTTTDASSGAASDGQNRRLAWWNAIRRFLSGPGLLVVGGLIGIGLVAWSARRPAAPASNGAAAAETPAGRHLVGMYRKAVGMARKAGVPRASVQTPREHAVAVASRLGVDAGRDFSLIVGEMESVVYGDKVPSHEVLGSARDALDRFRRGYRTGGR